MSAPDPIADLIVSIVMGRIASLQRPAGPHLFRVAIVHSDGRVSLTPDNPARGLEDIPHVDHWAGVAGGAALPVVGSLVLVDFADGDITKPVLHAYQPLRNTGGKPTQSTIDATTLRLGPTATAVQIAGTGPAIGRVGDPVGAGVLAIAMVVGVPTFTYTPPGGIAQVGVTVNLSGLITGGSSKGTCG